jgi:hypothetical protein
MSQNDVKVKYFVDLFVDLSQENGFAIKGIGYLTA